MPLPQRLLLIRLSAMGDVAMCVPVILALQRDYPNVVVIMLSRKRFKNIFSQLPNVTFITASVDNQHKGIVGLWRLSKEIAKHQPQAIADLHNVLRSKLLRLFLTGVTTASIDKGRALKKKLINQPDFFKPLKHTTERYADVFRDLGFKIDLQHNERLQRLSLSPIVHDYIGADTAKWIGFAPFAAHRTKALGIEKARSIAQQITAIPGVKLLLLGGGKLEIKQLNDIAKGMESVRVLAGHLDFNQELEVISNLDVMIAMDSGNGHLAAMYGVPVITLWGNTHPYAGFAPYAQPMSRQLTVDRDQYPLVPTSVFGNKIIDQYQEITDTIDNHLIIDQLLKLL